MILKKIVIGNLCNEHWFVNHVCAKVEELLNQGISKLGFKWLCIPDTECLFAFPFIFRDTLNRLFVTSTVFNQKIQLGKSTLPLLKEQSKIEEPAFFFDIGSNFFFPNTCKFSGKEYNTPKDRNSCKLILDKFDPDIRKLKKTTIISEGESQYDIITLPIFLTDEQNRLSERKEIHR
jgi:hypothetical protein